MRKISRKERVGDADDGADVEGVLGAANGDGKIIPDRRELAADLLDGEAERRDLPGTSFTRRSFLRTHARLSQRAARFGSRACVRSDPRPFQKKDPSRYSSSGSSL